MEKIVVLHVRQVTTMLVYRGNKLFHSAKIRNLFLKISYMQSILDINSYLCNVFNISNKI